MPFDDTPGWLGSAAPIEPPVLHSASAPSAAINFKP